MRTSILKPPVLLLLGILMLTACSKEEQEPKKPIYNTTVLDISIDFTEQSLECLDAVIEFKGFDKSTTTQMPTDLKWEGNTSTRASRTPASSSFLVTFKLKEGLTLPIKIPEVRYSFKYTCMSTSTEGTMIGNAVVESGAAHDYGATLRTQQDLDDYLGTISKGVSFSVDKEGVITRSTFRKE